MSFPFEMITLSISLITVFRKVLTFHCGTADFSLRELTKNVSLQSFENLDE